MIALRDLECLVALARHRHFARAAEHSGLSQPAFSTRIRNLEAHLETQIVKRGNRFLGLTEEGERVVERARSIIGAVRALEDEMRSAKGHVSGTLVIGAIPTAAAYAARAAARLRRLHAGIVTRIETGTSLAVQQGVDEGRFDAGLTYSEGASADLHEMTELYHERYVLLVPDGIGGELGDTVAWREAAALPLVLLERRMHNRRIIDQVLQSTGAQPLVAAEASGFDAALAMAVEGIGAAIVPEVLLDIFPVPPRVRRVALTDPVVEKPISLIVRQGETRIPALHALREVLPGRS